MFRTSHRTPTSCSKSAISGATSQPTRCLTVRSTYSTSPASATSCLRSSSPSSICPRTSRARCTCSSAHVVQGSKSSSTPHRRPAMASRRPRRARIIRLRRSIPTHYRNTRASRRRSTGTRCTNCRPIPCASSTPTAQGRALPVPTARCSACSCGKNSRASRSRWSATELRSRDFLYVTDVARAFLAAAETPLAGRFWNLGAGNPQSVNRLVELLGGEKIHIPKRPGEPDCTWADISSITKELGWRPQVSFEEGVAEDRRQHRLLEERTTMGPGVDR